MKQWCWSRTFVLASTLAGAVSMPAVAVDVDLSRPVPKIEARTPVRFAGTSNGVTIEFTNWKSLVAENDVVGKMESALFCSGSEPARFNKRLEIFLSADLHRIFTERAAKFGYAKPPESQSVFDQPHNDAADFRIGATLLAMDYRTCGGSTVKGDAYSKIKWEAFSVRRQHVVYSAIVESSFTPTRDIPLKEFNEGFLRAAVDNLLGDPKFAATIASGGDDSTASVALPPLRIESGSTVVGSVASGAPKLLGAVVTVESGVGSGTAFYISHDGYLLTNQHVVGDAKFVRIKLSSGHSLVGEVVRVDKVCDVALLHTDPVPSDVLGLRREPARVGEEVYAIGSPFGDILNGTLTHGVMSARRVLEGVPYLQSDVTINPGNSGGPLIDANGQVLGVTRLGLASARGINLFIPIEDVIDKLSLSLQPPVLTAPR